MTGGGFPRDYNDGRDNNEESDGGDLFNGDLTINIIDGGAGEPTQEQQRWTMDDGRDVSEESGVGNLTTKNNNTTTTTTTTTTKPTHLLLLLLLLLLI